MGYDENYYRFNSQDRDRPALWFYYRLWRRYCPAGPALDFGCGVGHLARRLSRRSQVYGIEINPYAIAQIHRNAPKVKVLDSLSQIEDECLASLVSLHVLEHIQDSELDELGRQFSRVLRAGGRAIFAMPDLGGKAHGLKGEDWLALRDQTHVNLKSAEEWRHYFVENWKMNVVYYGADGYYDFPYGKSPFLRLTRDVFRAFKTCIQFFVGALILKPGDGEAIVFVLEKTP